MPTDADMWGGHAVVNSPHLLPDETALLILGLQQLDLLLGETDDD